MNKASKSLLIAASLLGSTAITSGVALAQDNALGITGLTGMLGAGLKLEGRYLGSTEKDATFMGIVDLTYQQSVFLKYDNGSPYKYDHGLGYNFVRTPNLRAGVTLNWVPGREENDDPPRLRGTGNLADAVEVGVFGEFAFDYFKVDGGIRQDVADAHSGAIAEFGGSVGAAFGDKMRLMGRVGAVWATQNYNQYQWGISTAQAAASAGNGNYISQNRKAGFNHLNFMVSGDYMVSQNFGVLARLGWVRLMDQAEDSQLSRKNDQFFGNVAVTYKF